jgi:hypothetical protein
VAGVKKMPSAMDSPTTIAIAVGRPNCRCSKDTEEGITDTLASAKHSGGKNCRTIKVEKLLNQMEEEIRRVLL